MPKLLHRTATRRTAGHADQFEFGDAGRNAHHGRGELASSRRGVLKTGLGAGIGLGTDGLLAACSATTGTDAAAASGTSGGGWSLTDDRGGTVRLAAAPTRVVAYGGTAAALYDFGVPVSTFAGVFGPTKQSDGTPDPMAGRLPVDGFTVLGEAYGEFDVAQYARLDPQLLITNMWKKDSLWYVPAASASKVEKLAPTRGITVSGTPLTKPLAAYERPAGLLGANPNSSQATVAKTAYRRAAESPRTNAKTKSSIRAVKAGQIVGWAGELRCSYAALGPVPAGFAAALGDARKVV